MRLHQTIADIDEPIGGEQPHRHEMPLQSTEDTLLMCQCARFPVLDLARSAHTAARAAKKLSTARTRPRASFC